MIADPHDRRLTHAGRVKSSLKVTRRYWMLLLYELRGTRMAVDFKVHTEHA